METSTLLTCIEPRGREVYNTFIFHDDFMKMDFNYILQQCDFPPIQIFFCKQSEGWCFDDFVTELKKLSKECEFSNLQNSLIRDMIVIGVTDNHLKWRLPLESDLALDSALQLGHAYEENKKYTLELRRDFTQNYEVDQINRFRKLYQSRDRNPNPEVILKYKFCSGTHNKGSCQAYGKICNNCESNGHFAKCCAKKESHSFIKPGI